MRLATRTFLLLGLAFGSGRIDANEPAQSPADEATLDQALNEAELPSLIRDLDSDQFTQRQAATKKLRRSGVTAIPLLRDAALGGSMEVATRVVGILKSYLEVADARVAARQALATIAASKTTEVASLAREALKSNKAGDDDDLPAPPFQAVPIQIPALQIQGGGPVRIQVQAQLNGGPGGRRIQVQQVNRVRDITAEENGVKVKIHDDPDQGIDVEITRTENGKSVTKKFSAKNADELKKKHPEAYREFEKYGQNAGGAQLQIQAIPAVPVPVPAKREAPAAKEVDPFDEPVPAPARRRVRPR